METLFDDLLRQIPDSDFMRRMTPIIDQQIKRLAHAKFKTDPMLGSYSRIHSLLGSAIKRQGRIIEAAFFEALSDSNRFEVWQERAFRVSAEADSLATSLSYEDCRCSNLPYGKTTRTIQIDAVVFDAAENTVGGYELKRGASYHDAGKKRQIRRDTKCVQLLLKSYAEQRGLMPRLALSHVVFFYGTRHLERPLSLAGSELDQHFNYSILAKMTEAARYYTEQIHLLVKGINSDAASPI